MSQEVFIGYQDEDDDLYGYYVSIAPDECNYLKTICEKFEQENVLSLEEICYLSEIKEHVVEAQMDFWRFKDNFSEDKILEFDETSDYLGRTLESFDIYRGLMPQMKFLVGFCLIDYYNSDYDEDNDEHVYDHIKEVYPTNDDYTVYYYPTLYGWAAKLDVPEELINVLEDWMALDGREELVRMVFTEPDEGALGVLIEWWSDNMAYFEDVGDPLTTVLFRALRNNLIKRRRTGKLILTQITGKHKFLAYVHQYYGSEIINQVTS